MLTSIFPPSVLSFVHFWLYLSKASALLLIVLFGGGLVISLFNEFRGRKTEGWLHRSLFLLGSVGVFLLSIVLLSLAYIVPPQF